MKISYAITVCDEHIELKRLTDFLVKHIESTDEIVIQRDATPDRHSYDNVTKVEEVIVDLIKSGTGPEVTAIDFVLNGDFSKFKNNLNEHCSGDYIFQIDADEMPSINLITNIHEILNVNPDVDLFKIPRENFVKGIQQTHMIKWGWLKDEFNRINYPDLQGRLYRNKKSIFWKNNVHESITGVVKQSMIPLNQGLDLIHRKTINKQEVQNAFYSTL